MNKSAGIDTLASDQKKMVAIAAWLYKSFDKQLGKPSDSVSRLAPLSQFRHLATHKEKKLWCGQFQAMFGFFCTAAGLINRYVEIVPVNGGINAGDHEVNEVWLRDTKKWVMADVTRNFFLIGNAIQLFSAAEYLGYRLQNQPASLYINRFDSTSGSTKTERPDNFLYDNYFNKNYALRYYLSKNLSEVYAADKKIKRYVLGTPWYEMYDPGSRHLNLLFRLKQIFIFGFFLCLLLPLLFAIKNKLLRKNSEYQISRIF